MNRRERRANKAVQPKCKSCGDRGTLQRSPFDGRGRCPRCHPMHMQAEKKKHEEAAPVAQRVQEIQLKLFETLRGLEMKEGEETAAIHAIGHLLATMIVQQGGDEVTARERMAGWVRSTMIALELPVEEDAVLKMPPEIATLITTWRQTAAAHAAEAEKFSGSPGAPLGWEDPAAFERENSAAETIHLCIDELVEAYDQPVQPEGSIIIMPG